jgi:GNAT superfamily N-acetyltransferase
VNRTQGNLVAGLPATTIRTPGAADLAAVGTFFAGLTLHTRVKRFFAPVWPGPAMLRTLCGTAGRADVLVADRDGVIIGHAMAVDYPRSDAGLRTDLGVVVADAWQGRGLGAALVRALVSRAQARGVTEVVMDVMPSNRQVLAMITSHWAAARTARTPDSVTVQIPLPVQLPVRPPPSTSHAHCAA